MCAAPKSIKGDIYARIRIVYVLLFIAGLLIVAQIINIKMFQAQKWRKEAKNIKIARVEGKRGDIYDCNNNLLVTSLPVYDLYMDIALKSIDDSLYNQYKDSLAIELAQVLPSKSVEGYKNWLDNARKNKSHFELIGKNISYHNYLRIKKMPIFRLGRYRGGLIENKHIERNLIHGALAKRTIGDVEDTIARVGIEKSYDAYLRGKSEEVLLEKMPNKEWMPLINLPEQETDGSDVYTTIDVNFQDVAHNALLRALRRFNAKFGCAIVMEVETGAIKAMVNLRQDKSQPDNYYEGFNDAIGTKLEPGSTFKLASAMVLLNTGKATPETMVYLEKGKKKYYNELLRDDKEPKKDTVNLQTAFAISSNVGISKLVTEAFENNKKAYYDALVHIGLNEITGIDLVGEVAPRLKNPEKETWSGITLPWMSIGYEAEFSPLQILVLYNAVANNGKAMKPYLVAKIMDENRLVKQFYPQKLRTVCSKATALKLKKMMQQVVDSGTAENIYSPNLKLAGKTGTTQLSKTHAGKNYQASFAGFFPVENPKYACIVVINDLSESSGYYGSAVAAPVFKEIAEKIYFKDIDIYEEQDIVEENDDEQLHKFRLANGNKDDITFLLEFLGQKYYDKSSTEWIVPSFKNDSLVLQQRSIKSTENIVPSVMGMGARDAVFILENSGFKPEISGYGYVVGQKPKANTPLKKGNKVYLNLK
ncbi:MAG: penicillin-binding protein [Chitinophagales bacterium]|nr:transpeptidase family protein [Bacteroidota bacterium]